MVANGKKDQQQAANRAGMIRVLLSVFFVALLLYVLWIYGLEEIYARFILIGALLPVSMLGESSLSLAMIEGDPVYTVSSMINSREYSWSLSGELFLLPVVLLISWQIALFFFFPNKQAGRIAIVNLIIFILVQILFLFLLSIYWKSEFVRIVHDMMNNNLIILVLFLIIKDILRYNLIPVPGSVSVNTKSQ